MNDSETIVNKVAQSDLLTIDLEEYFPKGERIELDIKPWLFLEEILKEKDFRESLKNHNWEYYQNKHVSITCSADAIIPTWAYMLVVLKLTPFADTVIFGSLEKLEEKLWDISLQKINPKDFQDKKIVIKGCSKLPVPVYAYTQLTHKLSPFVSSLMYGEPCSTVPLYKKPKN
ncbi:MAG: DUF2480 family protein [Bacteroidota bacterium]|nr:DUF2480 family protein [Bacteroidota bacterium]